MKTIILLFCLGCIFLFTSCQKTDFSKPDEVIKDYRAHANQKNYGEIYDNFLSTKSKKFVTRDEYINYCTDFDSTSKITRSLSTKILPVEVITKSPSYKRFKVDETFLASKDTLRLRNYYTLINENGEWKVIWTGTLGNEANDIFNKGNYSDARKSLDKIKEIDPLNGRIYDLLAWTYLRDQSISRYEAEKEILGNIKYALSLEADIARYYNTLGSYYSAINEMDLSIMKLEQGITFCLNNKDKTTFLSNIALQYLSRNNFSKAEEYIKKTIELDNEDTFGWMLYGRLMKNQNKNEEAVKYFEKALKLEKMDNALMSELYYLYAGSCLVMKNYPAAKEYISKALDIDPDDDRYKYLYRQISAYSK